MFRIVRCHKEAVWAFCLIATVASAAVPGTIGMPVLFEANRGQIERDVAYLQRSLSGELLLRQTGFDLLMRDSTSPIRMRFAGISKGVRLEAEQEAVTRSHYYRGRSQDSWITGVPNFDRVRYRGLYPGIDAVFYGNEGRLEYDFVVQPGADASRIQLGWSRSAALRVDVQGDLWIGPAKSAVRQQRPVAYQVVNGRRIEVAVRYRVKGQSVDFVLGSYDLSRELVVDPVLSYATLFGGSNRDEARKVTTDAQGNVYLAGYTNSPDITATNGRYSANNDVLVTKLDPTGKRTLFVAILGGTNADRAESLALDTQGNVYVGGYTESAGFPTRNAFQANYKGSRDAFVAKLDSDGALVYSSFLGGAQPQPCGCSARDHAYGVAVNSLGEAYVTGVTFSRDFPLMGGGATGGDWGDAFVTVVNASGSGLIFSTVVGGREGYDAGKAIVVDPTGDTFVAGNTASPSFPTTDGAYQRMVRGGNSVGDVFLARYNPRADVQQYLVRSTLYGGNSDESAWALAQDRKGDLYVSGNTRSTDLPTSQSAFSRNFRGGTDFGDMFIARFDEALTTLKAATYVGGSAEDSAQGVAIDGQGRVLVAGWSHSPELPNTASGFHSHRGGAEGVIARFAPELDKVDFLSFLGGGSNDYLQSVAVNMLGQVWVAGISNTYLPHGIGSGSMQQSSRGDYDTYLALIDFSEPPGPGDPSISIRAITNAASYANGAIAPGTIVVLFGSGLGPAELAGYQVDGEGRIATEAGGTRVLFAGVPAPVLYASAGQTAVIVPYAIGSLAAAPVVVEREGLRSPAFIAQVSLAQPGLFTADRSGRGPGAILNADGTPNSQINPSPAGSVVVLYGTGEGQTTPYGVDGQPASAVLAHLPRPILPVRATVGGKPASILYAGAVPNVTAGQFQMNLELPTSLTAGSHEVVVWFGSHASQAGVTVSVR